MKTGRKTRKEEGIAIILTLGILALISIMALFFVATSITNRKTARNYNELTSARMLAQSAVNRAIAAMKKNSGDLSKDFSYVNSQCSAYAQSDIESREDLVSLLPTVVGGVSYFSEADYEDAINDTPSWQYIPTDASSDTQIIGRIAFITIADNGKIMPTAGVDSGWNVYNYNLTHNPDINAVTEYDSPSSDNSAINDAPATSIGPNGEKLIGRPGVSVSEIWLGNDSFSSLLSNNDLKKLSSEEAIPAGKMPKNGWGSSDVFFDLLNINNENDKEEFLTYFTFGNPPDPEAFWIDANLDEIKIESELFHRFNLQRTDWDSITVNSIVNTSSIEYNSADDGNIQTSIPWLKNWTLTGDYITENAWKYQIAANLIDYCDADIETTSDIAYMCPDADSTCVSTLYMSPINCPEPGCGKMLVKHFYNICPDFLLSECVDASISLIAGNCATCGKTLVKKEYRKPTYTGLEKCPYINEVQIKFVSTIQAQDLGSSRQYAAEIVPEDVTVEVVNLYDLLTHPDFGMYSVNAILLMDWEFTIAGITYTRTDDIFDRADVPLTNASAYRYTKYTDKFNDQSWHNTGGWVNTDSDLSECIIENIKIKDLTVKLENAVTGDFYDFSFLVGTDVTVTNIPSGTSAAYFYSSVDDPRQNLLITDWADSSFAVGSIPSNTFGAQNSNCAPNPGGNADSEPEAAAGNLWDLSTAYIRNAPMQSPWELGAIHRGKKWQTINLKVYDDFDDAPSEYRLYPATWGGRNYSDGDANILDQIKMGAFTQTLGKINLNSPQPEILKTLFYGIYSGSGFETPGTNPYDEMIENDEAETLADDVTAAYSSVSGEFDTRAEVLRQSNGVVSFWNNSLWSSQPQTNDASQEEIIGKFINLTKAGSINSIVVVAVAQTIKDVGGGITIKKDLNSDGVIGNFNESTTGRDINGDGDAVDDISEEITEVQYGAYDQFADEITATQKVFVIVYRNPATNEFRIGRMQYLDD